MSSSKPVQKIAVKKRPPGPRRNGPKIQGGGREANRLAVVILEVLAGTITPTDAADALKISLPRYYILEKRALEGLVAGCEPRPMGKQPSPEIRIAVLEKELKRAERECARQQALVRLARQSVGLSAASSKTSSPPGKSARRGRKTRRPTVRALAAAESLRERIACEEPEEVKQGARESSAAAKEGDRKQETPA